MRRYPAHLTRFPLNTALKVRVACNQSILLAEITCTFAILTLLTHHFIDIRLQIVFK